MSAAIRTEPASAVPSEAPNWLAVFWRPPTSGLSSSGTAETVTAPELRGEAPHPEPDQQHRPGHDRRARVHVHRAKSTTMPTTIATSPSVDHAPRRGRRAEPRGCRDRGEQHREGERRDLDPRVDRREPERDRQVERDHEEHAHHHDELEEEHHRARRHLPVPEERRGDERLAVLRRRGDARAA